jgi:hypothetical protein
MAGFPAMIAFWLRMDHLGVLAGVGFLVITHSPGSFSEAWKGWFLKIYSHLRWISLFLGLLFIAFFSVPLRNWVLGGKWVFTDTTNLNILWCNSWSCVFENFQKLLLAYDPHLPFTSRILFGLSALILFGGTILGLLALVWRRGAFAFYPLSLGLTLAGLIFPYLWVKVVAYPPRFSIHLLPLASLSLSIILFYFLWPKLQFFFAGKGKEA